MARVDYGAIQNEIRNVLIADATLAGVTVELERESLLSPEQAPFVGVYLDRRRVSRRPIAAGTRVDYKVSFVLWCYDHSLDSLQLAAQQRDDLLGKVEVALMKNPTLNGKVIVMTFADDAGEFESARTNAGFLSGGSIHLEADVKSTTS